MDRPPPPECPRQGPTASPHGFASALLLLASAVVPTNCGGSQCAPESPVPPLSADVHVFTPEIMARWCSLDPEGMCGAFRPVPRESLAYFEHRLPQLLGAHGYQDVAAHVQDYLRQYWAALDGDRLLIHGVIACRSLLDLYVDVDPETGASLPLPSDEERRRSGPLVVDDAGRCYLTVSFPADSPNRPVFSL